jgi:hypothetical protein
MELMPSGSVRGEQAAIRSVAGVQGPGGEGGREGGGGWRKRYDCNRIRDEWYGLVAMGLSKGRRPVSGST